jgi:uncharacterized protein YoxC
MAPATDAQLETTAKLHANQSPGCTASILKMLTASVDRVSRLVNSINYQEVAKISPLDNQLADVGADFTQLSSPIKQWSNALQDGLTKLTSEIAIASPANKVMLTGKQSEFLAQAKVVNPQLMTLVAFIDRFDRIYNEIYSKMTEIKLSVTQPELYQKVRLQEDLGNKINELNKLKKEFIQNQAPVIVTCEELYKNIKEAIPTAATRANMAPVPGRDAPRNQV